jgi:uncharacterized protein
MLMRSVLALAFCLAISVPAAAQKAAAPANTLAAADRLIAAQDVNAMMKDMATGMAKSLPEAARGPFIEEMTDQAFMARYTEQMRTVMAKNFSVEELDALADFYSKPLAKSAMAKMGTMMSELMPFLQGEMPAMVERLQKRVPKP